MSIVNFEQVIVAWDATLNRSGSLQIPTMENFATVAKFSFLDVWRDPGHASANRSFKSLIIFLGKNGNFKIPGLKYHSL